MTVEELVDKKDLYNSVVFIYDNHKGYYIYTGKAKDIPQMYFRTHCRWKFL